MEKSSLKLALIVVLLLIASSFQFRVDARNVVVIPCETYNDCRDSAKCDCVHNHCRCPGEEQDFFTKAITNHLKHDLFSLCSLRFLLKQETGWASVSVGNAGVVVDWACDLSTKRAWAGLGFGLRLETPAWWWWLGVAISAWWWLGVAISAWWWLGLADLGVVVAWACRSCGSRPGFADLGLGLPSLFLLFSGVRYIIISFSFPLFS
uniref:Transmembrane protein n=1 Tax=Fagus sylvatica TaxID=28930 RepID=A0A2N9FRQ0_FAGSY